MISNKNKKLYLFAIICIAAVALYFILTEGSVFSAKSIKQSYSQFYQDVAAGDVISVKITDKSIEYNKNDNPEIMYFTENPDSPTLKEYLLINGVDVKVEKSSTEILSLIFDVIFYGFFISIVLIIIFKFVSPNTFKVVHKTGKSFSDIVGMDNLKRDMKQIMDMMKNPASYNKKGIRMPKGILLEGDPGNGKTLFAKALAGEAKVNFIPTKATDFESMFMAIGPMKVKLLFKKARRRAPCIVFIDEFDGIGTRRNYSGSAIETENTRIVTALLNELDGFEANNGIMVIAATNSINALDPALIRPGRFDARISVPYPDSKAIGELVTMYTRNKSLEDNCSLEKISARFKGFSCAKIESVINRAVLIADQDSRNSITMEDIEKACVEQKSAM